MRIHTLGPATTDSYAAAESLLQEEDEIVGYPSFDNLLHHLPDLKGEHVLFPVAFQSARREYGWKEFHYDNWQEVELVKVFPKKLKPMVLVKNPHRKENRAMIHPATTIFLKKYLEAKGEQTPISYTDSKYKAWQAFCKKELHYTIISEDVYEEEKEEGFKIVERYEPEMVWCLYKVKNESNQSK